MWLSFRKLFTSDLNGIINDIKSFALCLQKKTNHCILLHCFASMSQQERRWLSLTQHDSETQILHSEISPIPQNVGSVWRTAPSTVPGVQRERWLLKFGMVRGPAFSLHFRLQKNWPKNEKTLFRSANICCWCVQLYWLHQVFKNSNYSPRVFAPSV